MSVALGADSSGTTGGDRNFSYAVTLSGDPASAAGATARIVVDKTGGMAKQDVEALVRSFAYANRSDAPTSGSRVFAITSIRDNGGTTDGGVDTTTNGLPSATVAVTPTPDAPVIVPSVASINVDQAVRRTVDASLTLTNIDGSLPTRVIVRLSDFRAGKETIAFGGDTTRFQVAEGTSSGNRELVVSLRAGQTATLADWQTALRSINYTYTDTVPLSSTLERTVVMIADAGTSTNSLPQDPVTWKINVGAVNEAPRITLGTRSFTVAEDGSLTLSGVSITDSSATGDTQAVALSVTKGTLSYTPVAGDGVVLDPASGSRQLNFVGSFSNITAAINRSVYRPDANVFGSDQLSILALDFEISTPGGPKSSEASAPITITSVPDAARIGGGLTGTVREDQTLTATGTVTVTDPDPDEASMQATSQDGRFGRLVLETNGAWTYSLDNARPAVQALGGNESLTDSFTVRSKDGTEARINITVRGTNDPASISGTATGSVTEGATAPITGKLDVTDVDAGEAVFQVATAQRSASGYGRFSITANGNWSYLLDNSNPVVAQLSAGKSLADSFIVRTAGGESKEVQITIVGANDAPTFSGSFAGQVVEAGGSRNGEPGTPRAQGVVQVRDPTRERAACVRLRRPSRARTAMAHTLSLRTGRGRTPSTTRILRSALSAPTRR